MQQYNFTSKSWRTIGPIGQGFFYFGCAYFLKSDGLIFAVGDEASAISSPVMFDAIRNSFVHTKHQTVQRFGATLVMLSKLLGISGLQMILYLFIWIDSKSSFNPFLSICYELLQRFMVTGFFAGQHNTKLHGTIYRCYIKTSER